MVIVAFIKSAVVLLLGLIVANLTFGPGSQLKPESFKMKEKPEFLGPLSSNNLLDFAQRLFEGTIGIGPESIVIKDNVIYTGVAKGRIQRMQGEELKTLIRIGGENCGILDPNGCGRPLGMRLNRQGDELVVADMYKGLYTVNIETGKLTMLVPSSTLVEGEPIGLANDLAIASDGDIYFSDANYKQGYNTRIFLLDVVENAGNGRLLHYSAENKTVTSLVSNIHFANGVELSPEEDYVIFTDLFRAQLLKYHLRGHKKGQVEMFHDNLPGMPDNIRRSPRGTYWLAMAAVRLPYEDYLYEQLSEYPFVRRVLYSTGVFVLQLLDTVKTNFPNPVLDVIHERMNDWLWLSVFVTADYGLILEFNSEGEIIRSLHSPKGVLTKISQVTEHENTLYIGSYMNDFIAKLSLDGHS